MKDRVFEGGSAKNSLIYHVSVVVVVLLFPAITFRSAAVEDSGRADDSRLSRRLTKAGVLEQVAICF